MTVSDLGCIQVVCGSFHHPTPPTSNTGAYWCALDLEHALIISKSVEMLERKVSPQFMLTFIFEEEVSLRVDSWSANIGKVHCDFVGWQNVNRCFPWRFISSPIRGLAGSGPDRLHAKRTMDDGWRGAADFRTTRGVWWCYGGRWAIWKKKDKHTLKNVNKSFLVKQASSSVWDQSCLNLFRLIRTDSILKGTEPNTVSCLGTN